MTRVLFLFLPFFVACFWILIYNLEAGKTDARTVFSVLFFCFALIFFTDAYKWAAKSPETLIPLTALMSSVAYSSAIPLTGMYLRKLRTPENFMPMHLLWIVIPVVLLTAGVLLHLLVGTENVTAFLIGLGNDRWSALSASGGTLLQAYYIAVSVLPVFALLFEMLWLLYYLVHYSRQIGFRVGHVWNFLFKGGGIKPSELQFVNVLLLLVLAFVKIVFFRSFGIYRPQVVAFGIINSLAISLFAYAALFCASPVVYLKKMTSGWRFNYPSDRRSEYVEREMEDMLAALDRNSVVRLYNSIGEGMEPVRADSAVLSPERNPITAKIYAPPGVSSDEDRLMAAFRRAMLEDKLFLQPKLTLDDVAEYLGSNKSYVSRLVNTVFNVSFPELVNTLRVDYAEQYILDHRGARQDEIAAKSGFLSASSFNNTFKKIAGMTPKIWLSYIDRQRMQKDLGNK